MITVCRQDRITRVGLQKLENNICWLRGFAQNVLWDIFCKTEEAHMYSIICVLIRAITVSHVVFVLFANSLYPRCLELIKRNKTSLMFLQTHRVSFAGCSSLLTRFAWFLALCCWCSVVYLVDCCFKLLLFLVVFHPLRQITIFLVSPLWPLR